MRKVFSATLGACAAVVALSGLPLTADEPHGQKEHQHAKFMDCAKACGQCALACDACSAHCAHMVADGKKDHFQTLRSCQDCAAVCGSAACVTARSGPFSDIICTACAEACKRCGDACATHAHDEMMKKCSDECRHCEKACRDMLKQAGAVTR